MRIRIVYSKFGPLRYTGNLDMQRSWERTFRRVKLPLAYSQGFHPQPRIHQASALPLGFSSQAEVIDIWVEGDMNAAQTAEALRGTTPPGLEILQVSEPDPKAPALQTQVSSCEYQVTLLDSPAEADLQERVDALLAASTLPRQRREKSYDLRPLVEDLRVHPGDGEKPGLFMRLSAREGATGRPDEVLEALEIPAASGRIHRLKMYLADGQSYPQDNHDESPSPLP